MIAYLRDEDGADIVERFLQDKDTPCYAHAINICEVYYDFLRVADAETAKRAIEDLDATGLIISEEMDKAFYQLAGDYKATYRISLADSFALALTNRLGGELITSDHHELEQVHEDGLCPIYFFR